jgi:hypothetical protein
MNLDDFKSSWRERHDELGRERLNVAPDDIVARTATLERAIVRRDLIEAAAAVVVVAIAAAFLWRVELPMVMIVGISIIMLGAIEVVAVMFWTRHRDARPNLDAPLVEFCRAELQRVERQIQLLKSVTWWYSAPPMIGAAVMTFGMLQAVPELSPLVRYGFLAAFCACFLVATFIIARINARAVERELLPVRDDLAEVIRAMDDAPTQ